MSKDRLRESDLRSDPPKRTLTPAAERALAEAAARRAKAAPETALPVEEGGPSGEEPTRFGDWERRGLAIDF